MVLPQRQSPGGGLNGCTASTWVRRSAARLPYRGLLRGRLLREQIGVVRGDPSLAFLVETAVHVVRGRFLDLFGSCCDEDRFVATVDSFDGASRDEVSMLDEAAG